ncbi:MAG: hypothetical protein ACOYH4_02690 [Saccharofermentanales bacterium]
MADTYASDHSLYLQRAFFLVAHTFTHFAVDFACYFVLMSNRWTAPWPYVALVYVTIAFGTQLLIGMAADRFPKLPVACAGIALIAAVLIRRVIVGPDAVMPLAGLIVMAAGNALFHAYAGRSVLKHHTWTANGIFNGAGGFGLVLGTYMGLQRLPYAVPLVIALIAAAIEAAVIVQCARGTLVLTEHDRTSAPDRYTLRDAGTGGWLAAVLVTLAASVVTEWVLQWSTPAVDPQHGTYLIVGAMVWGFKIVGSRVFERAHRPWHIVGVTGLCWILTLLSPGWPPLCWIAFALIISINLIPLYGFKYAFPKRPGFAFGLNKLGLTIAFLLLFMGRTHTRHMVAITCLLILSILAVVLTQRKGADA